MKVCREHQKTCPINFSSRQAVLLVETVHVGHLQTKRQTDLEITRGERGKLCQLASTERLAPQVVFSCYYKPTLLLSAATTSQYTFFSQHAYVCKS